MKAIEDSGVLPKGYEVRIISGHRSWEEQDQLYAKGRSTGGSKVTNARGGQSNHNFAVAYDVGIFDADGQWLPESPLYNEIGPIGEKVGLEWGGRWRSFVDTPHYQVKTGLTLAQMREIVRSKGMSAIPVPKYGGKLPDPIDRRTVEVYDGKHKTDVPAFNESGRVWVGIRKFCHVFGGEITGITDKTFHLRLHGEAVSVGGQIIDGVGYIKFADANRVLEWGYRYAAFKLVVETGEA